MSSQIYEVKWVRETLTLAVHNIKLNRTYTFFDII